MRAVTREGYRNALAPVYRRLGGRRVQSLTHGDVSALIDWMGREGGRRGQPLSVRSVKAALVALQQALDVAHREGSIPRNEVRLAKRPREARPRGRDVQHWTAEQLDTFRDRADADRWAALWRLTLSGLTRADVMGLRWSDVDLTAGTVTVAQGRVALDHGDSVDEPKSAQRHRTVPVEVLHPGTVALLREYRGPRIVSGLVGVDAFGKPIRPEHYSDRFRALTVEAGLPVIRLHAVRHSLALRLNDQGVRPSDAAAFLGHTVEVYLSTYLPAAGNDGVARAASALASVSALTR